ncbi:hypothetical protein EP7_004473 [Isosphaeraceae bacterium EP7]
MAVKKREASKSEVAASTSKATKQSAPKKAAAKKSEAPAAPVAAPKAAPKKAAAPAPVAAKAPAAAKAPKKPAPAPIKLSATQTEFLKKIKDTAEEGYLASKKVEQKTLEALLNRKLIKKGGKDKTSGGFKYLISKQGEKHLETQPTA